MKPFFDAIRGPLFGGSMSAAQVSGITRILAACDMAGLSKPEAAYVLATAYHETGRRMEAVREHFKATDDEAYESVSAWCARNHRRNYAQRDAETGQSYYGRGYVQLTHKSNYAKQADKLGVDLVNNPDLALHPETSALILVKGMRDGDFTGKKLADYFSPGFADFHEARRIVNGTDRASTIAGYARAFLAALGPVDMQLASEAPETQDAAPARRKTAGSGFMAALLALAAVIASAAAYLRGMFE